MENHHNQAKFKTIDPNPVDQNNNLGSTNIKISPLGIGIWSWGDRYIWGFGDRYDISDLEEAYQQILGSKVNLIDTAEVYGWGKSEAILGNFMRKNSKPWVIATKFFPYPWRLTQQSVIRAVQESKRRLGIDQIDLYQMHMPFPPCPIEFWLQKLIRLYHDGHMRAVGVSNFNLALTKRAHKYLTDHGVPLVSNQLRYSLVNRGIESSGLLDYCLENGITVIAYSPLAMGILTGKYSISTPPTGIRRTAYRYTAEYLQRIHPVLKLMAEIGEGQGGKSIAQVALNWTMRRGTVPIPGAKNKKQVSDNLGALNWELTKSEIRSLDQATEQFL